MANISYKLWDKTSAINGIDAEQILSRAPFNEGNKEIIIIYDADNNKALQIECKDILAQVYNIDINLPLGEFMAEYFAIIEQLNNAIIIHNENDG